MAARDVAVRALLASVGLQGLGAKFAAHGIDDDSLYLIDDDDLREIGIGDDTRRRILAALAPVDDECPLCMEKSVEVRVTCSHTFCAKCLTAWRLKTPAGEETPCPTCRRPVLAVQKLPPRRPRTEAPELLRLRARAEAAEARAAALENADRARSAGLARVLQDSHRVRVSLAAAEADAAANDARALDALRRLESARVEALRFRGELDVQDRITGSTLQNLRHENDRLRDRLSTRRDDNLALRADKHALRQRVNEAEREQGRLVTENNRFRECLKHSEREKRDLVAENDRFRTANDRFRADNHALRQRVKDGERERRDLVAQNRAMASRQQELQKAEFARHTQEMQHQAAVAQAKLRGVLAHVAALERENARLRCSTTFASAPVLAPPGRPPMADSWVPDFAPTVAPVAVTPPAPRSEHPPPAPPPQKFSNDGSFLLQMKRHLAAASRIQTAWRNRAAVADAPTPPGEPVGLKRMPHGSATRKPLRPKN